MRVTVDFYDAGHEAALTAIPAARKGLAGIAGSSIEVARAEFLAYSLFHLKHSGLRKFASLTSIRQIASEYAKDMDDFLTPTLKLRGPALSPPTGVRERLGVALGLSAVSRVHGMTLADWLMIPVLQTKHLDFHLAATPKSKIQVETKGSVVADNTKRASVTHHAGSIVGKKNHLKSLPSHGKWYANIRYGTIAAVDSIHDAHVWLLDPEPSETPWSPRDQMIVSRSDFLATWLGLISPYSVVTRALRRRVGELLDSDNVTQFDRRPLLDDEGAPINPNHFSRQAALPTSFFYRKFELRPHKAFVRTVRIDNDRTLYIGVYEELLELAFSQDFGRLISYRTEPSELTGVLIGADGILSDQEVVIGSTSWGTLAEIR